MKTKTVYVSAEADKRLIEYLESLKKDGTILGINLVKPHADLDKAIASHPDEYMCELKDGIYFGDPSNLRSKYPGDVLYNAAAVGDYLICSKYTDKDLVEKSRLKTIIVPQGYVKCNISVIDDGHVITEDRGIFEALKPYSREIDCLLINPGEVLLPGYANGFIGGATGRIFRSIVFNGDLSKHSNFEIISRYIEGCNLKVKYFNEYPLTDIGSILFG